MAVAFVTQGELRSRLQGNSDFLILDVRSQFDYDRSSLKIMGAVRLPPDQVHLLSHQVPRDKEIIVYCCSSGEETGAQVARELRARGFGSVYPLAGGFRSWLSAGLELEPK